MAMTRQLFSIQRALLKHGGPSGVPLLPRCAAAVSSLCGGAGSGRLRGPSGWGSLTFLHSVCVEGNSAWLIYLENMCIIFKEKVH